MIRLCPVFWAFLCLIFFSCTPSPEPFVVGSDQCDHCRMQISDNRFGGELITSKGRILKFDSLQCLASYYRAAKNETKEILISDYLKPGSFVAAERAFFLRSDGVKDPMGPGLAASADEAGLRKLKEQMGGAWLDWNGVLSSLP